MYNVDYVSFIKAVSFSVPVIFSYFAILMSNFLIIQRAFIVVDKVEKKLLISTHGTL